jgi:hypothetical protein
MSLQFNLKEVFDQQSGKNLQLAAVTKMMTLHPENDAIIDCNFCQSQKMW